MRFYALTPPLAAIVLLAGATAVSASPLGAEGRAPQAPAQSTGDFLVATGAFLADGKATTGQVVALVRPNQATLDALGDGAEVVSLPLTAAASAEDGTYELRASTSDVLDKFKESDGRLHVVLLATSEGKGTFQWQRDITLTDTSAADRRSRKPEDIRGSAGAMRIDFDVAKNSVHDDSMDTAADEDGLVPEGAGVVAVNSTHRIDFDNNLEDVLARKDSKTTPPTRGGGCPMFKKGTKSGVHAWAANAWGWAQGTVTVDINAKHGFTYGVATDNGPSGSRSVSASAGMEMEKVVNKQFKNKVRYDYYDALFSKFGVPCDSSRTEAHPAAMESVGTVVKKIGNHGFKRCEPISPTMKPRKDHGKDAAFSFGVSVPIKESAQKASAGTSWSESYSLKFTTKRKSWLCGNDDEWANASQVGMHAR